MRITDLLKPKAIEIGAKVKDKEAAIEKLVSLHDKCGNLKDRAAFKEGILSNSRYSVFYAIMYDFLWNSDACSCNILTDS